MSQTVKFERMLIVSASSDFTITATGDVNPVQVEPIGSITRSPDGNVWKSLGGGNWTLLGSGTPDGSTLSSVTGVLNALPLSGTVNARFANISGTVDGHFNSLSGTIDARLKANPFTLIGDLVVPGSITGSGDVSLGRNLIVSSLGNFQGNVLVTGSITGSGDAAFSRNVTVSSLGNFQGNLLVTGSVTGSGDAKFSRNLTVSSLMSVGGNLIVTGSITGSGGFLLGASAVADFGGNRARNAADPVATQDLVTLGYFNAHNSGGGGGGGVVTGVLATNVQRFSYFANGTEGSYFTVNLPSAQSDTLYTVFSMNASTSSFVTNIPSGSRTTTSFKVQLTAAPSSGDELDFFVIPSTNTAIGALTGVAHDATLTGDGTGANPLSVSHNVQWFGTGYDGALTFDGSTTCAGVTASNNVYILIADIEATNMTVSGPVTIKTMGYRIFVTGTLTHNGVMADNGASGTRGNDTNGGGPQPGGPPRVAGFYSATNFGLSGTVVPSGITGSTSNNMPRGLVTAVTASGGGFHGGLHTAGSQGTFAGSQFQGGPGGGAGGGNSFAGYDGAGAGAISLTSASEGSSNFLTVLRGVTDKSSVGITWSGTGGGGGGVGGDATGGWGGGGGAAAGIIAVFANKIAGSGSFTATGGNGGNGGNATSGNSGAGGGGGGGAGGFVVLVYNTNISTCTTNVTGGAGGTGGTGNGTGGNGANGLSGGNGEVIKFNLSGDGT